MSIYHRFKEAIGDAAYIWQKELKTVYKDEGVFIFFILVPLFYPLLYSWIYNNEVVRDVPVCVVDQSHSQLSRQFIRYCDASPDVRVAYYATDLDEARSLVSRQLVKGVYLLPSDFAERIGRMEQATVSVYSDMALMLTYKAIYQTAMAVAQQMGSEQQKRLAPHFTDHEDAVAVLPLKVSDVPLFNPSGGYGSGVLPAVLMLILQQTLALGIGLAAGTARERNRNGQLVPADDRRFSGVYRIVCGKALCYIMIYAVMGAYLTTVVPRIFSFPMLAHATDLLLMMLPYLLACVFFGMTVSCMVRYRENVMLLIVFMSVPLLFLTGVSWPQASIPGAWQGISWLFPSTFGVRAYIRLNTMGASFADILPEVRMLWIQTVAYFALACLVYGHQLRVARRGEAA